MKRMKSFISAGILVLFALAGAAQAEVPGGNSIQDISWTRQPGGRVQLVVRMDKPLVAPESFTVAMPPRITLDFPATRVATAKRNLTVHEGALESVSVVEADGRARLVLKLDRNVAWTSAVEGKQLLISLDAPGAPMVGAGPAVTHFPGADADARISVKGIDFRRGPKGDGRVLIQLSEASAGIDVREEGNEILVDVMNAQPAAQVAKRYDVSDFATPVRHIDASARGAHTRIRIQAEGRFESAAYQVGNVFTVAVRPLTEQEKKGEEVRFGGDKLSLNFQNIDVRAALQVLADFTGLNFVISDTVQGKLTLRLKDVPWDEALNLIVDTKGLAARRKGDIVTVAPANEVAAKEKIALEAAKSSLDLEPLATELIPLSYAKADDIANLLKSIKAVPTAAGGLQHPVFGVQATGSAPAPVPADANTLLSPRGQVTVDERTNSVLIQDTREKIREVRKLVLQLDQPVRQVMIETRLVEASDTFSRNLGVRLGYANITNKSGGQLITTGTQADLATVSGAGATSINDGMLNVNLPAPPIGSTNPVSIALGFIKNNKILDLELSALQNDGIGKIVSNPRLITANQKKAIIEQGEERVFTTNVLGVGSVVTKKATLKLEVTPRITPDDRVGLDVLITKDHFVDPVNGLLRVKQVQTNVVLDNGETVVIGGIYEQDKATTEEKVPLLGDIPGLGWLFKNQVTRDARTELLIFLTPRILAAGLSAEMGAAR